jgi:predicted nucleic acid-binding protein
MDLFSSTSGMTVLADTSIWVDGLRASNSWLPQALKTPEPIAYTEPVLMELLLGARNESEWENLRRFVSGGTLVPFDSASDFEAAAAINWLGRRRGITAGKVDCLILAVAQRADALFITRDRGQGELAQLLGIDLAS